MQDEDYGGNSRPIGDGKSLTIGHRNGLPFIDCGLKLQGRQGAGETRQKERIRPFQPFRLLTRRDFLKVAVDTKVQEEKAASTIGFKMCLVYICLFRQKAFKRSLRYRDSYSSPSYMAVNGFIIRPPSCVCHGLIMASNTHDNVICGGFCR